MMEFESELIFETEEEAYTIKFKYKFSKGTLELLPKSVNKNIIFPFPSELISINALSTYEDAISVNIP